MRKTTPAKNKKDSRTLPRLTAEERGKGWMFLFNGKNFDGWRGLGREGLPEGHWTIEDDTIKKVPSGVRFLSRRTASLSPVAT
ncbi:MAG: DUF1080 domain-containing protein [Acidobacteria bacterium]|nr:DUF1080 domain-containing protein [Acidobacteriota bacterium]